MAAERRKDTRRYRTNGSVAYQPEFEQESARRSSRRELVRGNTVRRPEPARRPQPRPRRRPAVRPDVQVRTQSAVAPFTVVGLFAVLACAWLLVVSCAKLAVANSDIVDLRAQLSDLQDEGRTLQAKYELVFDLEAIEKQFLSDGSMVRPGVGQTVYLDLSGGDRVVYYDGAGEGLSGLLQRAERFFAGLVS
ncbi:MAG: hypothetical protein HFF21_03755 [Oscillospiraceae bacterium]|jgi:cell division protein FtsB|nr:hypothetical protein [Oscillospiraceae bacterium]